MHFIKKNSLRKVQKKKVNFWKTFFQTKIKNVKKGMFFSFVKSKNVYTL